MRASGRCASTCINNCACVAGTLIVKQTRVYHSHNNNKNKNNNNGRILVPLAQAGPILSLSFGR